MKIGLSLALIAIGAILTFAVNVSSSMANLDTIGIILMAVGALGLVFSLLFWNTSDRRVIHHTELD